VARGDDTAPAQPLVVLALAHVATRSFVSLSHSPFALLLLHTLTYRLERLTRLATLHSPYAPARCHASMPTPLPARRTNATPTETTLMVRWLPAGTIRGRPVESFWTT